MRESEIRNAVQEFWRARKRGTQSDSHPKAFLDLIAKDLARAGWTDVAVKKKGGKGRITIPGYFRPAKEWDIVCWDADKPVVAIELKTQADSYGNNENNRYEEALGNALDVRARYGKRIGLGFVFVICDEHKSRIVTRPRVPNPDAVFEGSSHVTRRVIFARRIVDYTLREGPLYDGAAVLIIRKDGSYEHPEDGGLGLIDFAAAVTKGRKPA